MKSGRCTSSILLALLACGAPVPGDEPAAAAAPARPSRGVMSMLDSDKLIEPVAAAGKPAVVKDGILELRGPIDSAMRERFDEAVDAGNVTTVRITSQGGSIAEALQIATAMQARDLDVIVRGLCAGACAQYIFIAGNRRTLEKRALVGFINSMKSTGTLLGMATETLEVANPAAIVLRRFASIEEEIYRRSGVAASLLVDPHMALQPQCVIVKREGGHIGWNMSNTYSMWVPARKYLKAAGLEFEGDWPRSRAKVEALANRYLKGGNARFVRYGDDDHLRSKQQPKYSLEEVRKCVLDELPTEP